MCLLLKEKIVNSISRKEMEISNEKYRNSFYYIKSSSVQTLLNEEQLVLFESFVFDKQRAFNFYIVYSERSFTCSILVSNTGVTSYFL